MPRNYYNNKSNNYKKWNPRKRAPVRRSKNQVITEQAVFSFTDSSKKVTAGDLKLPNRQLRLVSAKLSVTSDTATNVYMSVFGFTDSSTSHSSNTSKVLALAANCDSKSVYVTNPDKLYQHLDDSNVVVQINSTNSKATLTGNIYLVFKIKNEAPTVVS